VLHVPRDALSAKTPATVPPAHPIWLSKELSASPPATTDTSIWEECARDAQSDALPAQLLISVNHALMDSYSAEFSVSQDVPTESTSTTDSALTAPHLVPLAPAQPAVSPAQAETSSPSHHAHQPAQAATTVTQSHIDARPATTPATPALPVQRTCVPPAPLDSISSTVLALKTAQPEPTPTTKCVPTAPHHVPPAQMPRTAPHASTHS
jgi:hypothetical protein